MSDDPRPAERVYVTVNETRYELVQTSKLTFPETKEAKRISGMPLVDMEVALGKADPDAWFAWMYVSIRRTQPTLTERQLEQAIGDTPIVRDHRVRREGSTRGCCRGPPGTRVGERRIRAAERQRLWREDPGAFDPRDCWTADLADPNLLGIHPYQLNDYTPAELTALLAYAQAKRDALNQG